MITPRPRFTKLYETLTPENRHATDHARTRCGLPASQDLRRIYIYIYTLRSSATGTPKAQQRARTAPNIDLFPRLPRLPRPPCGSRLPRDAGHPARSPHVVTAPRLQPAETPRVTLKPRAKLLRCYMTAGLRHVSKLIYQKCNMERVTCFVTCQT